MLSLVDNRDTEGSSREIATSTWMSAASPKAGGSGNGSGGGGASKSRGSRLLNRWESRSRKKIDCRYGEVYNTVRSISFTTSPIRHTTSSSGP